MRSNSRSPDYDPGSYVMMSSRVSTMTATKSPILDPPPDTVVFPVLSTSRSIAIILVCVSGFIISNMSQLAINVMTPSIQSDLQIDSANIQWISSAFTLAYGSTLLLAGRLSDIYGHKLCLTIGLALFASFSLASAMARTLAELAAFRAIQGLGASTVSPAMLGILARTFAPGTKMRTEAFASFSAGSPLGSSVGLFVGGWLTQGTRPGWRSFFYFSLALSAFTLICACLILPPDPPSTTKKSGMDVDWIGALLIVTGLVVLVASLTFNPRYGWQSPQMLAPFVISLALITAFVVWEYRFDGKGSRQPLLPLSLFKKKPFGAVQCVAGLLYMAYTDQNYFFNTYFQKYLKLSLNETLIRFLPLLVVGLALNLVTGHVADILPAQVMIVIGCLATSASCALSSIMDPKASYWVYNFGAIALSVVGADFVFSVGAMFGSKIASDDEQAIAGAVLLSSTRIVSAVGLGMATIAQVEITKDRAWLMGVKVDKTDVYKAPKPAYFEGLRASFYACLAFVSIATLVAATCLWGMGYVGAHHKSHAEVEPSEDFEHKETSKDNV